MDIPDGGEILVIIRQVVPPDDIDISRLVIAGVYRGFQSTDDADSWIKAVIGMMPNPEDYRFLVTYSLPYFHLYNYEHHN